MNAHEPLLNLLCRLGLVDPARTGEAREGTEGPIRTLARLGYIDERETLEKVAAALGISVIDLDSPSVRARLSSQSYATRVDPDFCWRHRVVPLYEENGQVVLCVADPLARDAVRSIEFALGTRITLALASENSILGLLSDRLPPESAHYDLISDISEPCSIEILGIAPEEDPGSLEEMPPIIRLCNHILQRALLEGASDIHIEPLEHGLDIRIRVDGVIRNVLDVPKRLQLHVISRLKVLAGMDIAERRRPQDGRLQIRFRGDRVDLRVSSVPTAYGEKMVLRVLGAGGRDFHLSNLGLPERIRGALAEALQASGKLLLTTGPTGSGKTTTLYACLNFLRDGSRNIETVEDPVECRLPGVNQIQVNETINVTFASALRSILRQDPDVIMVGEIRDPDTAHIALQAAQTGHLVISSLHTNDAPSAIARLMNLGIEPYLLAGGLRGILAQRLVRKLCSECPPSFALDSPLETRGPSSGCPVCGFTGYKGRVGVFSYLEITPVIAELIHAQASTSLIIAEAKKRGFQELDEAALTLVRSGITSFDEIRDLIQVPHGPIVESAVLSEEKRTVAEASSGPRPKRGVEMQKIVLVEDDPEVRDIFAMVLKRDHYDVIQAENGLQGLEKVYEHCPELVLCDLMMPTMNGKDFLARMRSHPSTKDIPVVILTAANTEMNEIELLSLGARDFLAKTASSAVILSRIRRVLSA